MKKLFKAVMIFIWVSLPCKQEQYKGRNPVKVILWLIDVWKMNDIDRMYKLGK